MVGFISRGYEQHLTEVEMDLNLGLGVADEVPACHIEVFIRVLDVCNWEHIIVNLFAFISQLDFFHYLEGKFAWLVDVLEVHLRESELNPVVRCILHVGWDLRNEKPRWRGLGLVGFCGVLLGLDRLLSLVLNWLVWDRCIDNIEWIFNWIGQSHRKQLFPHKHFRIETEKLVEDL